MKLMRRLAALAIMASGLVGQSAAAGEAKLEFIARNGRHAPPMHVGDAFVPSLFLPDAAAAKRFADRCLYLFWLDPLGQVVRILPRAGELPPCALPDVEVPATVALAPLIGMAGNPGEHHFILLATRVPVPVLQQFGPMVSGPKELASFVVELRQATDEAAPPLLVASFPVSYRR